jgi:hypothetical protein
MRDAQKYLEHLEAQEVGKEFDLTVEMDKAKDLFSTLHQRANSWEVGRSKIIADIKNEFAVMACELNGSSQLTSEDKEKMLSTLESIFQRLICPFTEKGSGGPQEMSDATMIRLQVDTAEQVTRIAERVQKLKAINMITHESFEAWLVRFYQSLKAEFGTSVYKISDVQSRPIIEGVGEAMRRSGEPRRGI